MSVTFVPNTFVFKRLIPIRYNLKISSSWPLIISIVIIIVVVGILEKNLQSIWKIRHKEGEILHQSIDASVNENKVSLNEKTSLN
jgi:hypothetical protein